MCLADLDTLQLWTLACLGVLALTHRLSSLVCSCFERFLFFRLYHPVCILYSASTPLSGTQLGFERGVWRMNKLVLHEQESYRRAQNAYPCV